MVEASLVTQDETHLEMGYFCWLHHKSGTTGQQVSAQVSSDPLHDWVLSVCSSDLTRITQMIHGALYGSLFFRFIWFYYFAWVNR